LREALPKREARIVATNSLFQNKPCLHAYSASGWDELERRVESLPALRPEVQAFQRFYLSGGHELELDSQGRFLLPQALRKHAGLNEFATLVGMGDKLEIWSAESWRAVNDSLAASFEETLAAIARLEGEKK
jgi:MraZ protein